MIRIREAIEKDNDVLIELQRQCPQGTNFVLGVDSSPDYFARSRPFKDWRVFVAVEDNSIVGSAACAIGSTYVEGRQFKTAYEYGFIVDPHYRRKGVAVKLQKHIEHVALDENIDLLYLDITEDNLPSIYLFSKMGFKRAKDCTTFSLMVYRKQKITRETNIRKMEKNDLDKVTNLINEMYHDYNFFTPFQTRDFVGYVRRLPYFDLHNIFVYEDNEGIKACLGYWNYNKVRKYIIQKFNWRLKAQTSFMRLVGLFTKIPEIPKLGEPLSSYNLTTLAYKDPESITELIKHVVNMALENKINFLHMPVDPESQIAAVLSQFRHTKIKLHFFIKSLKQKRFPDLGERKLYIDAAEI
ncbi:GNAT family N-acetyltransferase [Candidatus Bathyarchaeota archaeon]|nr:GNAT family N-acetyltransferase [Candidatus Bathyarchaeota archaeon]